MTAGQSVNVRAEEGQRTSIGWVKLLYLVIYASYGTTMIYRNLFYRRVGMDGNQIGLLIALPPLIAIVAGPVWGLIADRLGIHDRLLTIVTALNPLPLLAMIWLHSFGWLVALAAIHSLFWSPIQSLTDSIALSALGPDRYRYSVIRAYGSLGYAPVAWLTGILIQGNDIRWIFVGYAFLMGTGSLLSLRVRTQQRALPRRIGKGLGQLVRDRRWQRLMLAIFLAMLVQEVTNGYGGLYLDTLGASESLIGFSGALGSIVQTVVMLTLLPALLSNWGSERLLKLSFGMFTVRFALWAALPFPVIAALNQALLGLSFGAALVAAVDLADRYAPEGMAATSQALVTSLITGLGRSLGGMLGGVSYEGIGPQPTFALFGGVSILSGAWFALTGRRKRKQADGDDASAAQR